MSEPIPATLQFRAKVAAAVAAGTAVPRITHAAWGTDGTPAPIDESSLRTEVHRQPVDSATPEGVTLHVLTVLHGESVPGHAIRELGLIDSDGDLAARRTFGAKELESGTELEITLDLQF